MPETPPAVPAPAPPAAPTNTLSPTLLALLCCPLCPERPPLRLANDRLICDRRGHVFPIHDGLPDLRPESGVAPTDSVAAGEQAVNDLD